MSTAKIKETKEHAAVESNFLGTFLKKVTISTSNGKLTIPQIIIICAVSVFILLTPHAQQLSIKSGDIYTDNGIFRTVLESNERLYRTVFLWTCGILRIRCLYLKHFVCRLWRESLDRPDLWHGRIRNRGSWNRISFVPLQSKG